MAGFSELEDAYAADAEGAAAAAVRVKRQRSMKNREFGLYASRLRQRPPTKQEAASDVPGTTLRPSHSQQLKHAPSNWSRSYEDLGRGADDTPLSPFDFVDDPAPQLPPLPLSTASPVSPAVVSPRWASLASSSSILFDRTSTSISNPGTPASTSTKPSSRTTSASSAPFAGLSSHPYIPEVPASGHSSPPTEDFPRLEKRHESSSRIVSPTTASPHSRPPSSKDAAVGANMLVENFSRPRKASVWQHPYDAPSSRPRHGEAPELDYSPSKSRSAWPRDRARGLSLSSNKSSSTLASVAKRPSNDHMRATRHGPGNNGSVTVVSPGLPRPPLAYSRTDSTTSGATPGLHAPAREPLPWVVDEELRSSYRSQLTGSTTQGTLFTPSGTERSSVLTKTSSRTSISIAPAGTTADEGLSVEDVMGMYEKGFYSTGGEDNDLDTYTEDDTGRGGARSGHIDPPKISKLEGSDIGNSIFEAMEDHLPLPRQAPPMGGEGPHVLRDSAAFFRNSGLPTSAPGDAGLRIASTDAQAKGATRAKRDSAKLLDQDGRSPLGRQESSKSIRSLASSAARPHPASTTVDDEATPAAGEPVKLPPHHPALQAGVDSGDPDSRDRYGFRKQNQYIKREQYDEWNSTYSEYLARRRRKWTAYLKDSGLMTDNPNRFPPPSQKTKRFIRKGIPPEWRGAAWFYYAQGPSILAKHAGEYDQLVQQAARGEAKEIDAEAIERDLHRTFPDNLKFKFDDDQPDAGEAGNGAAKPGEPEIVSGLRRVLLAFSIHNPKIGYCQSLNFLAGLLLLFVETEEQCFWLLNVVTRVYLPGTHDTSLEGSKVDLGVLMMELQDSMPGIWAKVGGELEDVPTAAAVAAQPTSRHGTLGRKSKRPKPTSSRSDDAPGASTVDRLPPITLCMTAWFMSCFIGTLPIETTLRVWDIFFYEGSKTLFRVALGIFKLGESEIRSVTDPMEMFSIVQAIPRRMLDCNMVMEATFRRRNGFGHISQESIDERRRERRDALRKQARMTTAVDDGQVMMETAADGIDGLTDSEATNGIRRKGTLFGRRRERWPVEV